MSNDLFCWNIRGLNKYSHRSGLKKWCRKNSPLFGGLLESHVKSVKKNKFVSELFPGWSSEDNYGFSPLGKIWIVWHPSLLVSVFYKSLQMIFAEVTWPSAPQSKVVVSVIYASNDPKERALLWSEILAVQSSHDLDSKPWLVIDDFNQT